MVEIPTIFSASKRHRQSRHIQRKPVSNLYHAPRIAAATGMPLNSHVTINFNLTNCPSHEASALFEMIRIERFGPWIRRPPRKLGRDRDPCAYAWVLENPSDLNAHWMVHLPQDRTTNFKFRVEKWLASAGIEVNSEHAVHVTPAPTPVKLMYYLMKGINPAYAELYGVRYPADQGKIVGRRSGVSRSLGPTRKAELRDAGLYRRPQRGNWVKLS